jgi:uracil-DNA glycosylase
MDCHEGTLRYLKIMDCPTDGPTGGLLTRIAACRICAERFAATETAHEPRPVVRVSPSARILIAGQAPGARVHASGLPFDDPSGDRLRDWMGVDRETFYDRSSIAVVPMAFCFPGYDDKGSDLPPPRICATTWRAELLGSLPKVELTLIVGQYAQAWHLGARRAKSLTMTVRDWRAHGPALLPLPHPSWRNTAWLKKNPWFAEEILPWLRSQVARLAG